MTQSHSVEILFASILRRLFFFLTTGSVGFAIEVVGSVISAFITGNHIMKSAISWNFFVIFFILKSNYVKTIVFPFPTELDALGRRTAMMIVNIPLLIGWYMMYFSDRVWEIFGANLLLGFGAGLMESEAMSISLYLYVLKQCQLSKQCNDYNCPWITGPVIVYVGEIW